MPMIHPSRPAIRPTLGLLLASLGCTSATDDPYTEPIEDTEDVAVVAYEEFTSLPEVDGAPARPMLLVDEPGSERMFVNDMWGPLYTVGYDGEVARYLDVDDGAWGIPVDASGRERGFQSFALHPQFNEPGTPGYGKLYTWLDTDDMSPEPHFTAGDGEASHHTVLLEWTATTPDADAYDGDGPRELLRLEQPFGNHNAGHIAFNPLAEPDDPDFGMLYVGVADGGSGGDPLDLAQDLSSPFGKILRIDPQGTDGSTGEYGVPEHNPFVSEEEEALPEIFASGFRNPQRFGWDPANGSLFAADIGQNAVEELSRVTPGADLGWNTWEGSFRFVSRSGVDRMSPRSDPDVTFPIAEFDPTDPLFQSRIAITGVVVPRSDRIPQLRDRILFGDMVSGEIFHVSADALPEGGQAAIRRVLLDDDGEEKTFLEVMVDRAAELGTAPPERTDLRFGTGPDDRLFLLNKHDGIIRELVP